MMAMADLPLVFGQETEYSLVVIDDQERRVPSGMAAEMFMSAARNITPFVRNSFDGESIFLGNGGRLYVDRGDKIELTTPECRDGVEISTYHLAGRKLMAGAAQSLERKHPGFRAYLYACPVDYVTGTTSGCHESYLVSRSPSPELAKTVLPFLVSRMILTGAGGLVPNSSGAEFSLSPRAAFLPEAVSETTTRERAIFCLKDEPLAAKYGRVHLLLGESLCSPLATYLKFATTAAVMRLADQRRLLWGAVALGDPVFELRKIAADPSCTARLRLKEGGTTTAIEIQLHYWRQVRRAVRVGVLPEWMAEACKLWRRMLECLEAQDWEGLMGSLDWVLKRKLFENYVDHESQLTKTDLEAWTLFLKRAESITSFKCLRRNMNRLTFDLVIHELNADFFGIQAIREILKVLKKPELTYADYKVFGEVRDRLWEYDMLMGEVRGIYTELEQSGAVDCDLIAQADIENAQTSPPPWGRAKIRGDWIRKHGGSAPMAMADWSYIRTANRSLDLADVFETKERWTAKPTTQDISATLRRRLRLGRLRNEE